MSKLLLTVYDTETTGLLKPNATDVSEQPEIIEFYGCQIDEDFNLLNEFETYLKPTNPVSDTITRITGITQSDVDDAPRFAEVFRDIGKVFEGSRVLVAHNAPFDVSMIANELLRINKWVHFPWPIYHLCTVERTMSLRGHRLKLAELHEIVTGKPFKDGAHRAKNDVHALVRTLHGLVEQGKIDLSKFKD